MTINIACNWSLRRMWEQCRSLVVCNFTDTSEEHVTTTIRVLGRGTSRGNIRKFLPGYTPSLSVNVFKLTCVSSAKGRIRLYAHVFFRCYIYLGSFSPREGKRPRHEVDSSPPSSAEIKNMWSQTSILPVCLHGVNRGKIYPL
jgi:hypothetical protein